MDTVLENEVLDIADYTLEVFIIHKKTLIKRKELCETFMKFLKESESFKSININVTYVTDFDPNTLDPKILNDKIDLTKTDIEEFNQYLSPINIHSVSNYMKHKRALELIASGKSQDNRTFFLVLEDDLCFSNESDKTLKQVLTQLTKPETPIYDLVFLGFPHKKPNYDDIFIDVFETYKLLPGCDAYLVRKSTATKLLMHIMPFKFIYNIQLCYLKELIGLKMVYYMPNVFIEGSKVGVYSSAINNNNVLLYNDKYMTLLDILNNKEFKKPESVKEFMDVYEQLDYKDINPDMLYLKALLHKKVGEYGESKKLCKKARDIYEMEDANINNHSRFLNDYIDVCRLSQFDEE
jgi:hypothetical protein